MKTSFTILLILFFAATAVFPQDDDGAIRLEFEARADVFQLLPCGENGVLVFYESTKQVDQNNNARVFLFYDKNLKPIWSKEVPVLKDLSYVNFYFAENTVYLTFQNLVKAKSDVFNFQLVKINILNSEFDVKGMFIPDKANLVNFEVLNNTFVCGFNYSKEQSLLIIKNLVNDVEKVIKFSEQPSFIKDIRFKPEAQEVFVLVDIYKERKQSALYLNSYDFGGSLLNSVLVSPVNPSEKLLNGQLNFVSSDEIYILGSFNNLNGRFSKADESVQGEESEGFYIAKIENGDQKFIKLHRLADFKNITKILNNNQLSDVSSETKKNRKKSSQSNLIYQLLMHDLVKNDDTFVIIAEAYYPEYHQVSTMSYDFYGRPMPYYYTVFDGYRYFNAFIAGLDKSGGLIWTNGIKIWDVSSFFLQKRIEVFFDGTEAILFYNHDGKIVSKVVDGFDEIGEEEHTRIASTNPGDVQLEASQGMVRHWYRNFFLAYGYQTYKNSNVGGGTKRRVFYLNKLVFN